mmetsp:Transcript_86622/g.269237  ORF Transcript_86622/g.269237 Transcript_86622/m.269237 type:complete len:211 (-) Transcript_86622:46-678(-)
MLGPHAPPHAERAHEHGRERLQRSRLGAATDARGGSPRSANAAERPAPGQIASGATGSSGPLVPLPAEAAASTGHAKYPPRQPTEGARARPTTRARWLRATSSRVARDASMESGELGESGRSALGPATTPTSLAGGASTCTPATAERRRRACGRSSRSAQAFRLARRSGTAKSRSGASGLGAAPTASGSASGTATSPSSPPAAASPASTG